MAAAPCLAVALQQLGGVRCWGTSVSCWRLSVHPRIHDCAGLLFALGQVARSASEQQLFKKDISKGLGERLFAVPEPL